MADAKAKPQSSVTLVGPKRGVKKADTKAVILNGTDAYPDDTFAGEYAGGSIGSGVAIIEPTYKPGTLYALTTQNNILLQCIEAMEVNIDGTGHSIDLIEGQPVNETEKQMLEDFFKNPYPDKSMKAIRRAIRRDIEATGNGYMEIMRNVEDTVMLINHADANYTRLLRLDDPIVVTRKVTRGGSEIDVTLRARPRRFVQNTNGKKIYFKEFGTTRDLDRETGLWAPETTRLPADKRASELYHFVGNKEPRTAYGTPRWINQLPSVLGSRKAEEHNLDFFDSGGIPPVLIVVSGGSLGTGVKESLQAHLSPNKNKHRAAIVEAVSTSGSLDSAGTVNVKVERFGAERQQDAMFQKYDQATEDHVRVSFRLPPLFVGKASDYNFATAYTAYMIAEAQVFSPEREEFDDIMNSTICHALGAKSYRFRSLPMTLTDVANQLKALEMVIDNLVSGEEVVKKLNEITGLGLEYEKQTPPAGAPGAPGAVPLNGVIPPNSRRVGAPLTGMTGIGGDVGIGIGLTKTEKVDLNYLNELASRFCETLDSSGVTPYTSEEQLALKDEVTMLNDDEYKAFTEILAAHSIDMVWTDQQGLEELCGCAVHVSG